jgi:hypothetical protein
VKYLKAQSEVDDLQDEFQREREDLMDRIQELSMQLKLKDLVMLSQT